MADIADVERALVRAIAAALYPAGTSAPSVTGGPIKVYRGWPDPDTLTRDLAAGACHVTIYSRPGTGTSETRAFRRWEPEPRPEPRLTATIDRDAATVTFGGTAQQRLLIAVVATAPDEVFSVAVGLDDTPDLIAARLATDIGAVRAASAAGPVLSVPGAAWLAARVLSGGTERRVTRDERQGISVTMWCPSPVARDLLGPLVESAVLDEPRLALGDGTAATVSYSGKATDDGARGSPMFRRDLLVTAEWAVMQSREALPIAVVPAEVWPGPNPVTPDTPTDDTTIRRVVVTVTP